MIKTGGYMMNNFNFERKFRFWFYQISHGEVIIRSPKNEDDMLYHNIDISIGAVEYLELPFQFDGLRITEATKEDVDYICLKLGKSVPEKEIIVLMSENKKYYIVASYYKILENDLNENVIPLHYCSGGKVEPDNSIQKIDKNEINRYDRKFKFWSYEVFPHKAVIRAPIAESERKENTIEIIVSNIKYLEIPWIIYSLKIEETTDEDVRYINKRLGENIPRSEILVILSKDIRYYIVAGSIEFIKSKLEHYQSFLEPSFKSVYEE